MADAGTELAGAVDRALERLSSYAPTFDDRIYHWVDGDHVEWTDGWGWTDGFWPGLLWLAHETSGDRSWAGLAKRSRRRFQERLAAHESHTHDMGFLYVPTSVAAYLIAGDAEDREMALAAARSLSARFNPFGRFIRAWNVWSEDTTEEARTERRGKAIIDTMMNLNLLWWASRETGDAMFAKIAETHARTTRRLFVREDGSTYHTYNFEPATGRPLAGRRHQGYADESCWSRGQAWAIYGYALAHTWTGNEQFLDTSRMLADYWLEHCPESGVPPWDFDAPEGEPPDSSAAAIAACGLMELARHLGSDRGAAYKVLALRALTTLSTDFLQPEPYIGLLRGGVSSLPGGRGVGVSLIYGDYFYLEGLLRAAGRERFCWSP